MSNKSKDQSAEDAYHEAELPRTGEALPPVDFTTFVLSLSTSALVSMGVVPDPEGHTGVNLSLARQSIDLVGLLHDKTKGNLTGEEERLLDQVLLDLRMKFVEVAGRQNPKPKKK